MNLDIAATFFVCAVGFLNSFIYGFSNTNLKEYYVKQFMPVVAKLRTSFNHDDESSVDNTSSKRLSLELRNNSSMELVTPKSRSSLDKSPTSSNKNIG